MKDINAIEKALKKKIELEIKEVVSEIIEDEFEKALIEGRLVVAINELFEAVQDVLIQDIQEHMVGNGLMPENVFKDEDASLELDRRFDIIYKGIIKKL